MADDLAVLGLENLAAEMARPSTVGFGGRRQPTRAQMVLRNRQLDMADRVSGFRTDLAKRADLARSRAARDTAVQQLGELDVADPDYRVRSNEVIRQNPDAIMDPAVRALLGFQDETAYRIESQRRFDDQQNRLIENRKADVREGIAEQAQKSRTELADEWASLPEQDRERFLANYHSALADGASESEALAVAGGIAKADETDRRLMIEAREEFTGQALERILGSDDPRGAIAVERQKRLSVERAEEEADKELSRIAGRARIIEKRLEREAPDVLAVGLPADPSAVPESVRGLVGELRQLEDRKFELLGGGTPLSPAARPDSGAPANETAVPPALVPDKYFAY